MSNDKDQSNLSSAVENPTATYEVGYRKPPKEKQFKPGQSGNSLGRPKNSRSPKALFEKSMTRIIPLLVDGRSRKIEVREGIEMRLANEALKGNIAAIKLVQERQEKFGSNKQNLPPTQLIVNFLEPDPEKLAAYKREDELFAKELREKESKKC